MPVEPIMLPDFDIASREQVSVKFLELGISTFAAACHYIQTLRYGRNADKKNLVTVLTDQCGTCSTKHALLKQLATENEYHDIKLMCGIYKMNGYNTPRVGRILSKYNLAFIPEAHNYLSYQACNYDFTSLHPIHFERDLLEETEIQPDQIADFKITYHKAFLVTWLAQNAHVPYSLSGLWAIREKCIAILGTASPLLSLSEKDPTKTRFL